MVTYECDRCKKIYVHKGNYLMHTKRKNPCKINDDKNVIADNKYELLIKKIEELEKEVDKLNNNPKVINNNKSKTLNVIITPNAFGNENYDFINDLESKKILSKGFKCLPKLI